MNISSEQSRLPIGYCYIGDQGEPLPLSHFTHEPNEEKCYRKCMDEYTSE